MAEGRYYRIKRLRKGVNRFTADDYDLKCTDIEWANIDNSNRKHVIVKHAKGKQAGVMTLIVDVLKQNLIQPESYGKYLSTNVKQVMRFKNTSDASKAAEIINRMASPDTVNRNRIQTDGSTTTNNGVKIKVDVDTDANGNIVVKEGSSYIPSGETVTTGNAASSTGINPWIIVGASVAAAVIVIAVIIKLRKKK